MRSSDTIVPENDDERYVWAFDQRDIDNPNPYAATRLIYLERIAAIEQVIARSVAPGGRVADVGCAQGNVSLHLAERGFQVDAFDLNASFLGYARKKWQRGAVEWHNANAFEIAAHGSFAAVILGEILEHVAHPDELLSQALDLVAPGGVVVATTPNGAFIRNPLPSYQEVIDRGDAERLEREQFGPGGEHHLFAYTREELIGHVPDSAEVLSFGYLGSGLFNSHVQPLLNRRRLGAPYRALAVGVTKIPKLQRALSSSLIVVLRRVS